MSRWAVSLLTAALGLGVASSAASAAPQGPWALPVENVSAPGQTATDHRVVSAPDGTAIAVWQRSDGSDVRIQTAARPPGGTFGDPANLSEPEQSAFAPEAATAPDGTTTVAWHRSNGSNSIIQAATRTAGGSFGAPIDLSAPGQNAAAAQIAAAPDGTTTAVWRRSDGSHDIIQAATRPPGGTFGNPVDLSAPGQSALEPEVAIAPDGTTTAVWRRFDGSNFVIQAATRPPGGSFGAPVDLSAPGQNASDPQIASARDGTATVVWERPDGSSLRIQAATRPPGGTYGNPVDLSTPGENTTGAQVTSAPDGTTTVVWQRSGDFRIQAATRPPGGTFGNPVDVSAPGQTVSTPQIATAPDGTSTVVWRAFDGTDFIIQAATRPPGGTFGNPVDLSAPGQNASFPEIAAAPDGTATAVWRRSDGSNLIIQSISTARPSLLLQAGRTGTGSGQVASTPAGIDCGTDCAEVYPSFTSVTLTASADAGSTFTGWSGAGCSGTGSCEVTMLEATSVTAGFGKPGLANLKITPKSRNVKRGGKGSFRVTVRNTGDATAKKLKVCVKGPKKLVKTPKCAKPGNLAAGKSKTAKFTVKVKKGAKKGRKAKLTFTATAGGGLEKGAKATVKVK